MADNKSFIDQLIKLGLNFLGKKAEEAVAQPVAPVVVHPDPQPVAASPVAPSEVDWSNPASKLSANFSVKESVYLNSWAASHVPSDEEKVAIRGIAEKVSKAIALLSQKIGQTVHVNVHAWMRPEKANIPGSQWDGHDYNRYIYETQVWKGLTPDQLAQKHVPNSPHKTGHAIDFHVIGYEGPAGCAKIRQMLLPHLEELGLRMEDLNGGWVHLDDLPVVHSRFFKP